MGSVMALKLSELIRELAGELARNGDTEVWFEDDQYTSDVHTVVFKNGAVVMQVEGI